MKTICASWAFLHSFINSGIISKYMSPNTLHMSILSVFLAFTWRPHSMWNIYSCAAASNKCYYTLESPFFFFFCLSFLYVAVVFNCPPHAAQRHLNMEEWQNKKIEQIRSVTNENNKQFSLPSDRGRKKTNNKRTLFISFFFMFVCVRYSCFFQSFFSMLFFCSSPLISACWRLSLETHTRLHTGAAHFVVLVALQPWVGHGISLNLGRRRNNRQREPISGPFRRDYPLFSMHLTPRN